MLADNRPLVPLTRAARWVGDLFWNPSRARQAALECCWGFPCGCLGPACCWLGAECRAAPGCNDLGIRVVRGQRPAPRLDQLRRWPQSSRGGAGLRLSVFMVLGLGVASSVVVGTTKRGSQTRKARQEARPSHGDALEQGRCPSSMSNGLCSNGLQKLSIPGRTSCLRMV